MAYRVQISSCSEIMAPIHHLGQNDMNKNSIRRLYCRTPSWGYLMLKDQDASGIHNRALAWIFTE